MENEGKMSANGVIEASLTAIGGVDWGVEIHNCHTPSACAETYDSQKNAVREVCPAPAPQHIGKAAQNIIDLVAEKRKRKFLSMYGATLDEEW